MNPQALIPEFEHEMAGTRKVLERIPDEHLDWRPHEKSFTLRELATHVANLPRWLGITLTTSDVDYLALPKNEPAASAAALVERFDALVVEGKAHLTSSTPEAWSETWSLRAGDRELFAMPRAACYRSFVMSHLIHHRGQLTVYLRLLNVPVPGLYGPSADEKS
jgi:uncharacterized damage-inducible protein DinB